MPRGVPKNKTVAIGEGSTSTIPAIRETGQETPGSLPARQDAAAPKKPQGRPRKNPLPMGVENFASAGVVEGKGKGKERLIEDEDAPAESPTKGRKKRVAAKGPAEGSPRKRPKIEAVLRVVPPTNQADVSVAGPSVKRSTRTKSTAVAPKWKVVNPTKEPPTSKTTASTTLKTLKPRIWTGSREELLALLPELAGNKCFNGISWYKYQTPMVVLDDTNRCFDIERNEEQPLFFDLVTTRSFVAPLPTAPAGVPLTQESSPAAPQIHPTTAPAVQSSSAQAPYKRRVPRYKIPKLPSTTTTTLTAKIEAVEQASLSAMESSSLEPAAAPLAASLAPTTSNASVSVLPSETPLPLPPSAPPPSMTSLPAEAPASMPVPPQPNPTSNPAPVSTQSTSRPGSTLLPLTWHTIDQFRRRTTLQSTTLQSTTLPPTPLQVEEMIEKGMMTRMEFDIPTQRVGDISSKANGNGNGNGNGQYPDFLLYPPVRAEVQGLVGGVRLRHAESDSMMLVDGCDGDGVRSESGLGGAATPSGPSGQLATPMDVDVDVDQPTPVSIHASSDPAPLDAPTYPPASFDAPAQQEQQASNTPTNPSQLGLDTNLTDASLDGNVPPIIPQEQPPATVDIMMDDETSTEMNLASAADLPIPIPLRTTTGPSGPSSTNPSASALADYIPSPLPDEITALIDAYLFGRPLTLMVSRERLEESWGVRMGKDKGGNNDGDKNGEGRAKGKGKSSKGVRDENEKNENEYGYGVMGFFRILGVQERRVPVLDGAKDINTGKGVGTGTGTGKKGPAKSTPPGMCAGEVQWRFRLAWAPGGEEIILPLNYAKEEFDWPWWNEKKKATSSESAEETIQTSSSVVEDSIPPDSEAGHPAQSSVIHTVDNLGSSSTATSAPASSSSNDPAESDAESLYPTTPRYRALRVANHEYQFRNCPLSDAYDSVLPEQVLAPFGRQYNDRIFPRGWLCVKCGRLNFQGALRHRRCVSEVCKDEPAPVEPYHYDLYWLRDPQERLPISYPRNTQPPGTKLARTTWKDGTQTFAYHLTDNPDIFVKHVFLSNIGELQKPISRIMDKIQGTVELVRPMVDNNPYFYYSAKAKASKKLLLPATPWEGVPECINVAKKEVAWRTSWFGKIPEKDFSIRHLKIVAWITEGSKRGNEVIRAKNKPTVLLAMGCTTMMTVTPRSLVEVKSAKGKSTLQENTGENVGSGWVAVDGKVEDDNPAAATAEEVAGPSASASPKKRLSKKDKPSFTLSLYHGDMVVFSGDDFEYSFKRDGTSFMLFASHDEIV